MLKFDIGVKKNLNQHLWYYQKTSDHVVLLNALCYLRSHTLSVLQPAGFSGTRQYSLSLSTNLLTYRKPEVNS